MPTAESVLDGMTPDTESAAATGKRDRRGRVRMYFAVVPLIGLLIAFTRFRPVRDAPRIPGPVLVQRGEQRAHRRRPAGVPSPEQLSIRQVEGPIPHERCFAAQSAG